MATGALDANGIWQYGEDDSEPTFSGMLNKLASSTSTTVTRLEELSGLTAAQLTTHRDNLGVGLVNVSPTSVAVSGGTASANAQGLVTFTGATSLSLNGVFTSAYEHYEIVMGYDVSTTAVDLFFRLRKNGVDATGADYNSAGYYAQNYSTATMIGSYEWNIARGVLGIAGTLEGHVKSTFFSPQVATKYTKFTSSCGGFHSSAVYYSKQLNGGHIIADSYDGITLYPTSGNVTGNVQIFGWNN